MLETCTLCKREFLTEADPYVVRPTPKGYLLYCCCQIKGFEEMKTPDTFDPLISAERYHIWCKHHQRVSEIDAEKLHKAEKEIEELKKDLEWLLNDYIVGNIEHSEKRKQIRTKHQLESR